MLSSQLDDLKTSACRCCGRTTTTFKRFVYRDGEAYGICYVALSADNPQRTIKLALCLGDFGPFSSEHERGAFTLDLRPVAGSYELTVTDPASSPWGDLENLAPLLDRDDALEHPLLDEAYRIVEQVVAEDASIRAYLDPRRMLH